MRRVGKETGEECKENKARDGKGKEIMKREGKEQRKEGRGSRGAKLRGRPRSEAGRMDGWLLWRSLTKRNARLLARERRGSVLARRSLRPVECLSNVHPGGKGLGGGRERGRKYKGARVMREEEAGVNMGRRRGRRKRWKGVKERGR